jgi:hypothetical protein
MKTLIISLGIGLLIGALTWGGLATMRHRETTPNAYSADTGTLVHVEKDSAAGPGMYRLTHPGWLPRHAEVTGLLAGNGAALIAFLALLIAPFSSTSTTPPHPDSAPQPTVHRRLLPP